MEPLEEIRDVEGAQGHVGSARTAERKRGFHSPGRRLGVALVTTTSGPDRKPEKSRFATPAPPARPAGGETLPLRRPRPTSRGTRGALRTRGRVRLPVAGAMEAFTRFTNQTQGRDRLFR